MFAWPMAFSDPHFQNQFREIGFMINSIKGSSYLGIFLLSVFVSYVVPFPEAIMLVLFGYVAKTSQLNIFLILLIGSLGAIIGDNILYRLSFFGNKYVEHFNEKMRKHKLIQYEHLVKDNIGKTIYFLRFIAGVRFFAPVISGTLGTSWRKYFLHSAIAATLHAVFFILLGYFYRGRIFVLIAEVEIIRNVLLFSSAIIVGFLLTIFASKKGVCSK
jgi:undecaprenyl-diphosphatase